MRNAARSSSISASSTRGKHSYGSVSSALSSRGGVSQNAQAAAHQRSAQAWPRQSVLSNLVDGSTVTLLLLVCFCLLVGFVIRRRAMKRASETAAAAVAGDGGSSAASQQPVTKKARKQAQAQATQTNGAIRPAHVRPAYEPPLDPSLRMPTVAIIGGGLSGLSCALALQRAGFPVTVYERDASLAARKQGFGLTLTNNPVGALNDLGVLDECIREDCPSVAHWVLKPDGSVLGYYGRGLHEAEQLAAEAVATAAAATAAAAATSVAASSPHSSLPSPSSSPSSPPPPPGVAERTLDCTASLRIPRENLRRMLYDRLTPGTVEWNYKIRDYTENHKCGPDEKPVKVVFEDGRTIECDVLVGADGVHSIVRKLRDAKESPNESPNGANGEGEVGLRYLEVAVVLGISPAIHPMLDARGFYIVDGESRLFTMPFAPAVFSQDGTMAKPPQTMWQLSFRCSDLAEARRLRGSSPEDLLAYALQRTSGWMEPVAPLIRETPPSEVWSTPLFDRDPLRLRSRERGSFVTVAGDAAHPCSMFKGQGANQALQDGPLLAAWLRHQHAHRRDTAASRQPGMTRDSLLTRIRQYEAAMVQRSTPRVLDSRRAAVWYHSPAACEIGTAYGLGNVGVRPGELTVKEVLTELARRGITAAVHGRQLEARVREVLQEMALAPEAVRARAEASAELAATMRRRFVNKTANAQGQLSCGNMPR